MQHKKILFAAAVMMASVMMFTGCASQEIQDRKAASEAAAIAAAQPTATPAPTPAPTPEPINAWSLLDNLPEFAVGTLDKPDMTWTDGLPLGVNPLTYEDGAFVSGLYSSASGSSTQIKSVSVKDLNEMPISGYLKLSVLETGETVIDSIEDAVTGEGLEKDISDFCVCTEGENGESANYYQIGFNGGPVSNVMDSTTAASDGMTIGNAFENGLFYSTMKPSALKDFPVDGTPEEKFNALYAVFGTPNGLYGRTARRHAVYFLMDRSAMATITNPDDLNAVEAALQLKDETGCEVVVVTMGPPPAEGMLRELMARGADRGVLVSGREFGGSDTFATSQILAAAVNKIGVGPEDIVFCGRQAIDGDTAQVGPQIAEKLHLPQVTYVTDIQKDGNSLTVKRQLEDGYMELKVQTPCLLTCIKELNTPRYMSVSGIFECYDKPLEVFDYNALKDDPLIETDTIGLKGSPTNVYKSFAPPVKGAGIKVEDAAQLVGILNDKHLI